VHPTPTARMKCRHARGVPHRQHSASSKDGRRKRGRRGHTHTEGGAPHTHTHTHTHTHAHKLSVHVPPSPHMLTHTARCWHCQPHTYTHTQPHTHTQHKQKAGCRLALQPSPPPSGATHAHARLAQWHECAQARAAHARASHKNPTAHHVADFRACRPTLVTNHRGLISHKPQLLACCVITTAQPAG
jgi:hypothetical protein